MHLVTLMEWCILVWYLWLKMAQNGWLPNWCLQHWIWPFLVIPLVPYSWAIPTENKQPTWRGSRIPLFKSACVAKNNQKKKRIRWKKKSPKFQCLCKHSSAKEMLLLPFSWIPSRGTSRQMMALVARCLSIPEGYEPSTSVGDTHVIHLTMRANMAVCSYPMWNLKMDGFQSMIYLLFQGLIL